MDTYQLGLSRSETAASISDDLPPVRRKPGRPRAEESLSQPLRTAEDVAEGLREVLAKSARSYLAIGQELIRRKQEVGHGEFCRLFRNHRNAIANPLPMSLRQAQRHMMIANDQRISRHFHSLPSDLEALGSLTKLSNSDFEGGILSGRIHDSLTRAQAKQFVGEKLPSPTKTDTKPVPEPVADDTVASASNHAPPQRLLGYSDSVVTRKIKLAVWRMFEDFESPNERAAAISALDAIRLSFR